MLGLELTCISGLINLLSTEILRRMRRWWKFWKCWITNKTERRCSVVDVVAVVVLVINKSEVRNYTSDLHTLTPVTTEPWRMWSLGFQFLIAENG